MKILKIIVPIFLGLLCIPNVFANYKPNIDDEVKLYNFTRDVLLRLEKFDNKNELQKRIKNKMLELSGGSKEDFDNYYNKLYKKYGSFREYGLEYIYHHITSNINEYYISGKGKILENSFARVFVNMSDIYMTEKGIFFKEDDGDDWNMVEFFKTDQSIEDFLNNTLLEEKYHGKCKAIKSDKKGTMFTVNQVYTIRAYGDYPSTLYEPENCGEYGTSYGIRYFEKRGGYIIYINAGQDFRGLFYRFIEIK